MVLRKATSTFLLGTCLNGASSLIPLGFEPFHELLEVGHVEADVIQRASLRRHDRCPGPENDRFTPGRSPASIIARRERQGCTVAARVRVERFPWHVLMPGMPGGVVVNLVLAHRREQGRFAVDFEPDAVWRIRIELVRVSVGSI